MCAHVHEDGGGVLLGTVNTSFVIQFRREEVPHFTPNADGLPEGGGEIYTRLNKAIVEWQLGEPNFLEWDYFVSPS